MAGDTTASSVIWNPGDATGKNSSGATVALPGDNAEVEAQDAITEAEEAHDLDDSSAATVATDATAALDALGAKINEILAALTAAGILEE